MLTSRFALISLVLVVGGCGKKNVAPPPPPVGWHKEPEGWNFECYFPPNWASLDEISRKQARSKALDEMMSQWKGERDDGVSFRESSADEVELVLLGRPELVEQVAAKNLEFCKASATTPVGTDAWDNWVGGLDDQLNAGQCLAPLLDTIFDYLDINSGWQRNFPICEGNKIRITGSQKDRFRTTETGPWVTIAGDPAKPTVGNTEYPCNMEGCTEGILMFKFTSLDGVETIIPVPDGELQFTAPAHGDISYRINDTTFYDNKWYKGGGIEDHTSIEISPQ